MCPHQGDGLHGVLVLQELWGWERRSKPHGTCHNVTACRTPRRPKGAGDSLGWSSGKTPKEVVPRSLAGEKGRRCTGQERGSCTISRAPD